MIRILSLLAAGLLLASCGADGDPVTPTYSTQTTIGYNSSTGPFNRTTIGVELSR